MRLFVLLLPAAALAGARLSGSDLVQDRPARHLRRAAGAPPAFELRTVERSAGECAGEEGSCARFRARYPALTGGVRPEVQESVNRAVARLVAQGSIEAEAAGDPAPPATVEAAAEEFLAAWRQARAELAAEASGPPRWTDERRMEVVYADPQVLSLELELYSDTAGAHPSSFVRLESFDLATGAPLELADLIVAGAAARLDRLGEQAFRRQREIPAAERLTAAGFWFDDDRFRLNENFAVTGDGLLFVFNPYEVGPYVLGATRIVLPWSELAGLLRRDAPVARAAGGTAARA